MAKILDTDGEFLFDTDGIQILDSDSIFVGLSLQAVYDIISLPTVGKNFECIWDIWGIVGASLESLWDVEELIYPEPPVGRTRLEIIRRGEKLDLSDELQFVHEGNTGFGMPPLHRISERGPLQDGVTDLGQRLDPRVIQLALAILSKKWMDQYDTRSRLLEYLSPAIADPVQLRFTLPDGATIRQIDCFPTSGPAFEVGYDTKEGMLKIGFSLIASDPTWYDPERNSQIISANQSPGGGWVVPIMVPMFFGSSTLNRIVHIDYKGTWSTFPEIEIVGQIENPKITNIDTNEKLDFDWLLISSGDSYTIDLRYGYKTVVNKAGDNKIADLTADSDLTSFHLQPGYNNFMFEGENITGSARFIIRFYTRYLGV